MAGSREYRFRAVAPGDAALLRGWFTQPGAARWFADPGYADEIARRGDANVRGRIVALAGRDIGWVQDYGVHGWGAHHLDFLAQGARGIDMAVGPPDLRGRGHGRCILDAVLEEMETEGVPAFGIDPHPDNAAAIACYAAVGFRRVREEETPWGRALLMVRAGAGTVG